MKKAQVALATFALLVITLLVAGAARADTFTYSYSSQGQLDLSNFPPCAPCRIMLSITVVNALAPSTTYTWDANGTTSGNPLDPILDMSFDNFGGLNGDVDPSFIEVVTDKSGNISDWAFNTISPSILLSSGTCTGTVSSRGSVSSMLPESIAETISLSNCTDMSKNNTDSIIFQSNPIFPSPWTSTTNVTTMNAPEPSSMLLLAIGLALVCLIALRARRLALPVPILLLALACLPVVTHADTLTLDGANIDSFSLNTISNVKMLSVVMAASDAQQFLTDVQQGTKIDVLTLEEFADVDGTQTLENEFEFLNDIVKSFQFVSGSDMQTVDVTLTYTEFKIIKEGSGGSGGGTTVPGPSWPC